MELITIGGLIVISSMVFYMRSIKYFRPNELVAISKAKEESVFIDETGETIYKQYSYQQGGRFFLPFWQEYYVLPVQLISTSIQTGRFLVENKWKVSVTVEVQYSIDVSTEKKRVEAFNNYGTFSRYKNREGKLNILNVLNEYIQFTALEVIPTVCEQLPFDAILGNQNKIRVTLQELMRDRIKEKGLRLEILEIVDIDILTQGYYQKFENEDEKSKVA